MRKFSTNVAAAVAVATFALIDLGAMSAHAQTGSPRTGAPGASVPRGFTPAPVPDRTAPTVAPSDRAGTRTSLDAGPLNSTPFSGLSSSQSGGSRMDPAERDTGERPTEVPNLSK